MTSASIPDQKAAPHHRIGGLGLFSGPTNKRDPLIDAELHLDAARELAHRSELEADSDLELAWDYERRALLHTITALRRCLDAIDHGTTT